MRWKPIVTLVVVAPVLSPGLGAEEPLPFDTYVGRTGTTTVWSTEVGRIQSETAELVVIALVVESCCEETVQQRRGIRIELTDQTTAHNLYIEQQDIPPVVGAVEGLESEINAGLIQVGKLEPNPGGDPDQISSCHGRANSAFHHWTSSWSTIVLQPAGLDCQCSSIPPSIGSPFPIADPPI
jgi:hypothetical protein